MQFIVTTHSPQLLSTVKRENIRMIEAIGEGIYEAKAPNFSPLAHRSSDALARIMGISPAPPWELTEERQQFEWYVRNNQEDTEEAKLLRQKLDDAGYEFHDSDLSSWRFIASRKKAKGI
jgi:predicted ATP-binding protein involved in virulence